MQVKLIAVHGDQEEFADLIGTTGDLHIDAKSRQLERNWYATPHDVIRLARKRVVRNLKTDTLSVYTQLGNLFTFKRVKT